MTDIQASIRAAVADSEGRTSRAIDDLRGDIKDWRTEFMPKERIEDRWQRDDKRLAQHDEDISALKAGQADLQRSIATLATKDDIKQTVKDATGGFASKGDVEEAISTNHKLRLTSTQQAVLFAITVLGFLSGAGVIHLQALAQLIGH